MNAETIMTVPFTELEGVSMTLKINYAHHFGIPKETVMEKLGISNKRFIDVTWLYSNKGYCAKVIAFLEAQRLKKERKCLPSDKPVPFNELEDCSTTFKINYSFYFGVPKQEVIEKLGISNKTYIDKIWLYENENYKQRIINFLESRKAA